jgi:hypothetical protein
LITDDVSEQLEQLRGDEFNSERATGLFPIKEEITFADIRDRIRGPNKKAPFIGSINLLN